ncbi:uncharacterized protein BX663DRAFT_517800 [Cokeromyces recurvatus]|uniref:uncharacterized protein n=1 Tax=Cokeromyces recurvatus TaxID=90255 RepID=UPI002220B68A|nr:uncharacterized protein BX663DRAFT_517800 [Cokeromyces recurvatus]KAI7900483.1 hypothetical protein BX663DRAFT_517800 [Cokeromyces recurvatus]
MLFTTPTMTSVFRTALQQKSTTYHMLQRQTLGSIRQFSSQVQPKKSKGSKILLATFMGAGIVGGIMYNVCQTKVLPMKERAKTTAFDPTTFVSLKLIETISLSHNTKLLRFAVPEGKDGKLPVASCVIAKYHKDGGLKPIIRPYTPVAEGNGHVDFIIKKYDDGKLTPIIHDLKPGDSLDFKGPMIKYDWEKMPKKKVGMIAGGTGITPMLQIIRSVFDVNSTDKETKVTLIFANQTEDDILLKDELDKIAKENPDRFKVVYALDKASENWKGITGYVTKEVVKTHLPSPDEEDSIIFVCGPPPMVNSIAGSKIKMTQGPLGGILKELGYSQDHVFKF